MIQEISKGSTFKGMELELFEVIKGSADVAILTSEFATVKIQFKDKNEIVAKTLEVKADELTLTETAIVVPDFIVSWPKGVYRYDVKITFNNGYVESGLFAGQIIVTNPVTN